MNSIDQVKTCKKCDNVTKGFVLFDKKLRVIDFLCYVNETEGFSSKYTRSYTKKFDENDNIVHKYCMINGLLHANEKDYAHIHHNIKGLKVLEQSYFGASYKRVILNLDGSKNKVVYWVRNTDLDLLGKIIKKYDNGVITKITEYLNVHLDGLIFTDLINIRAVEYSTIPDSDIRYVNKSTTFYDNGKPKSVTHYIWSSQLNERVIHSPDDNTFGYIEYYESGNLKKQINYFYGKIHSDVINFPYIEYYDEIDKIHIYKNYVCGVLHNHHIHKTAIEILDINQKTIKQEFYQCGHFISERIYEDN
jgi:antitoxin component YwqK of YwqJK toxin-antitoxin module